jgi:hypothetical protein
MFVAHRQSGRRTGRFVSFPPMGGARRPLPDTHGASPAQHQPDPPATGIVRSSGGSGAAAPRMREPEGETPWASPLGRPEAPAGPALGRQW